MAIVSDKIYCTKCGREIKDGLLYCDRCGQSVRKSMERQAPKTNNRAEAERIHREQIERKKNRREKELRKEKNRRKAMRRARALAAFVGILVLAAVCMTVSFIMMSENSGIPSNEDAINEDIAKNSPAATDTITSSSGAGTISTDFTRYEHKGISCPYPTTFKKSSGKGILNLTDTAGGAVMTISEETVDTVSGGDSVAQEMMFKYYDEAKQLDPNPENRCGSDWYVVTYTSNGVVHHRKCVISGAAALCYDFEYDSASKLAAEYENCIAKLDENFTASAQ